ncbi:tetratricopeptide repeat protein [Treponema phagedenis]|uniref:Tetratricopeptide repeat protein n=1 Tax=Treponema phagedenis TaxID=162 RepID=A0A0B7GUG2_TREPH|nr:tetratricopeptide repeat protein [Treponema phagedenis]EFW37488.1 tetratricopeptide repeat protein [Treponema phagedenis F0421]NVP24759.1 tetratricopeptide repeat protein [Treponema phagedenis]QEJ95871.1 tetratricopeptide repeat protein [Treponema phagedenis]QEJ98874.1 tetratricopeptide repeat protein [Treponema phagedenis]QEK00434.1 tetratricopeptide repeat protein [Treponema phagedenis]
MKQKHKKYTSFSRQKKFPVRILIVIFILLLLVSSIVFGIRYYKKYYASLPSIRSVYKDWNENNYQAVYDKTEILLKRRPLDGEVLALHGFASYYIFSEQTDLSISYTYLSTAVTFLRQALYFAAQNEIPKISYVLGKAYYQQGYYYADLAVKYLDNAYNAGFQAEDLSEFRGMAAAMLGDIHKAIDSFTQTLVSNPSDLVLYALAENYAKISDSEKAKLYFYDTIDKTKDILLELKCRNKLVSIYLEEKNFSEAEKEIHTVLEKDINSAEAHYNLGVIYEVKGDIVKARSEWRKALRLNPLDEQTRTKLNLK